MKTNFSSSVYQGIRPFRTFGEQLPPARGRVPVVSMKPTSVHAVNQYSTIRHSGVQIAAEAEAACSSVNGISSFANEELGPIATLWDELPARSGVFAVCCP
jgi:hypothetical protein